MSTKSITQRVPDPGHVKRLGAIIATITMLLAFVVGGLNPSIAGATPTTGTISGTVTNPDNSPAVGVTVEVTDTTSNDTFDATTDSNGAYTIGGVTPTGAGDRYIFDIIGADPTGPVYDNYNNPIAPVTLTAGQNLTGENTKLVTPGSISGTVTAGGTPIANVSVTASDLSSSLATTTGTATTDASGNYTINGLPPTSTGHYEVNFDTSSFPAPGYAPNNFPDKTDPNNATLVGATSSGTTGIDAHLVVGSTVSGQVVDTSGNPIANTELTLSPLDYMSGLQSSSATTDSNGNYSISGLPAANFELSIDQIDSQYQSTALGNPVIVPAATNLTGYDLVAPLEDSTTTGSAHGTVTDTSGNPIVGATVQVTSASGSTNPDGSTVTYTATTDANGKYSISNIAADSYDISIDDYPTYAGYDLETDRTNHGDPGDGSVTIDGYTAEQVDATLTKNAIFSGTIKDSSANPIPSGQVNAVLINLSNDNVIQIDEVTNGTWQLVGPAGTYKIEFSSTVWHDAYVDQWWNNAATEAAATPLTVTAGQVTSNMNVVLQPTPPAATVPGTPTSVSATAGNAQATVSWTAPTSDGGAPIENYWVTEYINGVQQDIISASGTSKTVTGLTNGTTYTFTVTAHNTVGNGPVSAGSNPVTPVAPATVPGVPTGVSATAGNAQATVSWSAPASNGGAAIAYYYVTVYSGGVRQFNVDTSTAATSQVITGLTNGTAYTFTVTAHNSVGDSAASAASNSVTPQVPPHTANQSFVIAAYTDFLGRAPTSSELSTWAGKLDAGTTRPVLLNALANSTEWVDHIVAGFYQDTLGRTPDASGMSFWVTEITSGKMTVAQVAANFYSSNEYFTGYGKSSVSTWIGDLYTKVLHRTVDEGGLAYWTGQTSAHGRTYVAYQIYQSIESRTDRVTTLYNELLHRAPDAGGLTYWANQLQSVGDIKLAVFLASSPEYFQDAHNRFP